jgi:hypothetical protein
MLILVLDSVVGLSEGRPATPFVLVLIVGIAVGVALKRWRR